jgi:Protein of unknown function (DUF935)
LQSPFTTVSTASPRQDFSKRPPLGEIGAVSAQLGPFSVNDYGVYKRPTLLNIEQMVDTDDTIRALESSIVLPIRQATPYIEDGKSDKGEADLCRKVLLNDASQGGMLTDINTLIGRMCGAFGRRRSFFEIVWKEQDGKIVMEDVAFRRGSTCTVIPDKRGRFGGFFQQGFTSDGQAFFKPVPRAKSFVYIPGTTSVNPLAGESVFESAYHTFTFKRKLLITSGMYFQMFGIPIKLGKAGPNTGEQEKMLEKISGVQGGASVVIGEDPEGLEIVQATAGADYPEMLRYLDTQMAISALVQWLMLGTNSGQHGSFALSSNLSDFFNIATQARMNEIAAKITSDLLAPLVFYNFGPKASLPHFRFASLADTSEERAAELWEKFLVAPAGSQGAMALHPDVFEALQLKALASLGFDPSQYKGKVPGWLRWGSLSENQGQIAQAAIASANAQPLTTPGVPGNANIVDPSKAAAPPAAKSAQQPAKPVVTRQGGLPSQVRKPGQKSLIS